ncbi:SGNH/GDSL hydrolase family protein [Roseomonas sp. GC11]|uniref:SGNH/GDSL hydrolase family protein n=1 Tax=Roseomonas sp. GC11 TaxID=2950546 RepID=UPI00210C9638|nr:SGNH/GDSL hydrolase family protein [Roseomonas sp. GC11]MCQ4160340.1 SGNH/GDSL hydrolase family protein [Roseomonas sp. GC11]
MQSLLAGLSLLILGDSHFATQGYLVTTLQDQLVQQGAKVATYAACGSPASVFLTARVASCGTAVRIQSGPVQTKRGNDARTVPLADMVRQHKPNLVIVAMGDTMAGYVQRQLPTDTVKDEVTALTDQLRAMNMPCVWIGPSWGTEGGPFMKTFTRVQQMSQLLSTIVAPCTYVDSTKLSQPGQWPTFDGQHYTVDGYKAYGTALATTLASLPQLREIRR